MTAAVLLLLLPQLPLGFSQADQATAAGRKALNHWQRYPWYDAASDSLRRIGVAPPREADHATSRESRALADRLVQWAAWIGLGLLLGGAAALLYRAYLRPRGADSQGQKAAEAAGPAEIHALPFPSGTDPRDLLGEARRHYERGDYGRAVVYLFSFQLWQLDKRQLIRLSKGKTNRQYLGELGSHRALRQLLEQTMLAFEDVFFGHHPLDRKRFQSSWSRLAEFEALADR